MRSSVRATYPGFSSNAERAEAEVQAAQRFSSTRGAALLLFSAMAAAVMAVAYEVMETTPESHLLVLWVGLWALAFAALALSANLVLRLKDMLNAWTQRRAQARADRRLWAMAQQDARIMADLQMAMARGQAQQAQAGVATAISAAQARAARALLAGGRA